MYEKRATPAFHGRLRQPDFYTAAVTIIKQHRRLMTLREVAEKLNAASLTTPTGLSWNRARLANFIIGNGI